MELCSGLLKYDNEYGNVGIIAWLIECFCGVMRK